jgi:hypothetical protein
MLRRNLTQILILAALAAGTAAAHAAQEQDLEFDRYACNIIILQDKSVQKELNIQPIQKFNLNKHADWFNADQARLGSLLQSGQAPKDIDKQQEAALAKMKEKVLGELSKWQTGRLREISLQQAGKTAVLDEKIAKKIGMNDAQIKELRKAYEENMKAAAKLEQDTLQPIIVKYQAKKPKDEKEAKALSQQFDVELKAANAKVDPVIEKMAKDFLAKIDKSMTEDQKKKYKALLGKPFKFAKPDTLWRSVCFYTY